MKNIILILIFQVTTSMAVDFIMTQTGSLTPVSEVSGTEPTSPPLSDPTSEQLETEATSPPLSDPTTGTKVGSNKYLEPVNLPTCDTGNPEVQFIRSIDDWNMINSSSKRIFCVSPGDYRSLGNIKLTASGTASKRRYIVLNNGNNIHPGKLSRSELANFTLFVGASYWVIDRWSAFDTTIKDGIYLSGSKATNNIINRGFTDNYTRAVTIADQSHNNTIQNCRFQNMKPAVMTNDGVAINIIAWGLESFVIKNTKIINNEVVTANDSFQITRSPRNSDPDGYYQNGNAEGTIIDGNHFYQDPTNMGGATAENAIDIKVGSDNPNNPVLITNNHMWGWDKDTTTGDGTAMVLHYSPKNVKIKNNVIFNSGQAIVTGSNGPTSGFSNGMIDGEVTNNLLYNINQQTGSQFIIKASSILRTDIHDNKLINCSSKKGFFYYNYDNSLFRNNIFINIYGTYDTHSNNQSFTNSLDTNLDIPDYTEDYTFTTDKFTNNPREITLVNAVKSKF